MYLPCYDKLFDSRSVLPLSNDLYCYFDCVEHAIDDSMYHDLYQYHNQTVSEDNIGITLPW